MKTSTHISVALAALVALGSLAHASGRPIPGTPGPADPRPSPAGSYGGMPADTVPEGQTGSRSTGSAGSSGGARSPAATPGAGQSGTRTAEGLSSRRDDYDVPSSWELWWYCNSEGFLELKRRIRSTPVISPEDAFVGQGQGVIAAGRLAPTEEEVRSQIVPVLKQAVLTGKSPEVVAVALTALAKLGDPPGTRPGGSYLMTVLSHRLTDPSQQVREAAVVSLGILGNPAAVTTLTDIMTDTERGRGSVGKAGSGIDLRTRSFAAYALGLIGSSCDNPDVRAIIVQRLCETLQGAPYARRDLEVAAVLAMGLVPVRTLETPPNASEPQPWFSREEQLRYLLAILGNDHKNLSDHIVRAHVPRSVVLLVEDCPAELRAEVARELGRYLGVTGRAYERELRQSAAQALGFLVDADTDRLDVRLRERLFEAVSDPDAQVQFISLIALARIGGRRPSKPGFAEEGRLRIRRHLQRQLAPGRPRRPWAAMALGVLERGLLEQAGAPASDAQLASLQQGLAREKTPDDVGALATGLGLGRRAEAADALILKLRETAQDGARGHLMVGLGMMRSETCGPELMEVLRVSKYRPLLMNDAALGLALLGDKSTVPSLLEMLESEAQVLSSMEAVACALGLIGDARAIEPLVAMAQDASIPDLARATAIRALGNVAEQAELPWQYKYSAGLNYTANPPTLSDPDMQGVLNLY